MATEARQVETLLNRTFEIIRTGTIEINKLAGETLEIQNAGLSIPSTVGLAFLAFVEYSYEGYQQFQPIPDMGIDPTTGALDYLVQAATTTLGGQLDIRAWVTTPEDGLYYDDDMDLTIRYYLLREKSS